MANDIVLQLDPSPANARNSEATFVTLRSGRLLLIWSKFLGDNHSDFGAGVIACRWSEDGGRTWSDRDRVLVRRDRRATNVMSPSALRLADGRIALLYLRKEGMDQCIPWIAFSDDELETLSEPLRVALAPGYYVVNNDRLIQLKSGRLIVPISQHHYRGPWELRPMAELPGDSNTRYPRGLEPYLGLPGIILFYFSDDGGRTWLQSRQSFYRCFADSSGLEEPGIVETKRGLWCYTRTGLIGEHAKKKDVRQWQSFSKDGGQTWAEPAPSEFVSPCSPMQVKRLPSRAGRSHLLAVWNDHSGYFKVKKPDPISWARTPLVCALSDDEGRTWKHRKLLEDSPVHGFCYPAIHFHDDAVLLSYNAGGIDTRNPLDRQRVRRITVEELYE